MNGKTILQVLLRKKFGGRQFLFADLDFDQRDFLLLRTAAGVLIGGRFALSTVPFNGLLRGLPVVFRLQQAFEGTGNHQHQYGQQKQEGCFAFVCCDFVYVDASVHSVQRKRNSVKMLEHPF